MTEEGTYHQASYLGDLIEVECPRSFLALKAARSQPGTNV
jgi:hypothetical protein